MQTFRRNIIPSITQKSKNIFLRTTIVSSGNVSTSKPGNRQIYTHRLSNIYLMCAPTSIKNNNNPLHNNNLLLLTKS